jgi:hypothetical protein
MISQHATSKGRVCSLLTVPAVMQQSMILIHTPQYSGRYVHKILLKQNMYIILMLYVSAIQGHLQATLM